MNGEPDIATRKRSLRDQMKQTLNAMSEAEREAASQAACERIAALPMMRSAKTIMAYLPLPGEIDCTPLLKMMLGGGDGRTVAVPHVDWNSKGMRAVRLTGLDAGALVSDRHGVRTPREIEVIDALSLDALIVPGVAFDESGRRLGRGGGFYDRFLAAVSASAMTIGLAFERQVVQEVPSEPHDARVRFIATESRIIDCG